MSLITRRAVCQHLVAVGLSELPLRPHAGGVLLQLLHRAQDTVNAGEGGKRRHLTRSSPSHVVTPVVHVRAPRCPLHTNSAIAGGSNPAQCRPCRAGGHDGGHGCDCTIPYIVACACAELLHWAGWIQCYRADPQVSALACGVELLQQQAARRREHQAAGAPAWAQVRRKAGHAGRPASSAALSALARLTRCDGATLPSSALDGQREGVCARATFLAAGSGGAAAAAERAARGAAGRLGHAAGPALRDAGRARPRPGAPVT